MSENFSRFCRRRGKYKLFCRHSLRRKLFLPQTGGVLLLFQSRSLHAPEREIQQFPVLALACSAEEMSKRRLNLKQCHRTTYTRRRLHSSSPSTSSRPSRFTDTFVTRDETISKTFPRELITELNARLLLTPSLSPSIIDVFHRTQRKEFSADERKIHPNENREINFALVAHSHPHPHTHSPPSPTPRSFSSDSWYQSSSYFKNKRKRSTSCRLKARERENFSNLIFV